MSIGFTAIATYLTKLTFINMINHVLSRFTRCIL